MAEGNSLSGLLDIELEANIRFGAREMSLAELLEIGPGVVIPLDRQVTDPVDLIIGEKVVARGEVVLIQGKFGLRITEVLSA
jgi:flagellar motor switch protein FliN/FliY